jgi:hypothetical protein
MRNSALTRARTHRSAAFAAFRQETRMKPINVWPMLLLLIVVLFMIFWLSGGLAR